MRRRFSLVIAFGIGVLSLLAGKDLELMPAAAAPLTTEEIGARMGHFHTLARLPQQGHFLLGTHHGLFISRDGGFRWEPVVGLDATDVMGLAASQRNPEILYASGHDMGVHKSRDGGKTWVSVNRGLPHRDVHAIAVSATDPAIVYIWIVGHGFFSTNDESTTWKKIETSLSAINVPALAVSPEDSNAVIAGSGNRLYLSKDGGATWTVPEAPPPFQRVYAVMIPAAAPGVLLAGTDRGLFRGDAAGEKWQQVAYDLSAGAIVAFAGERSLSDLIFALTHQGVILKGSVHSSKWDRVN